MLAPLDNEVIFKKAFTSPVVLRGFARDILDIDFVPGVIETEKRFSPPIGNVDMAYDIFAESADQRVIVEIQRVEYDYHFDRFLQYHNAAMLSLLVGHKNYTIPRKVYTIVVLTEPCSIHDDDGEAMMDDVLISSADPRTLDDKIRKIYGHKLVFLNSYHAGPDTPAPYRDWLTLIQSSVHSQTAPDPPAENAAVREAIRLIEYQNLTPAERQEMLLSEERRRKEVHMRELAEKQEKRIKDMTQAIEAVLEEKDKALEEQKKALEEKDKALEAALRMLAEAKGVSVEEIRRSM